MPATPSDPGPRPRRPRPLSEGEQRALAELEAHTVDQDPALAARMRRAGSWWGDAVPVRAADVAVQVCVVLVLALVVLPRAWAAGLLVLAGLVVPSAIAVIALQRGAR